MGIRFRDSDNRLPGQAHPALDFVSFKACSPSSCSWELVVAADVVAKPSEVLPGLVFYKAQLAVGQRMNECRELEYQPDAATSIGREMMIVRKRLA